MGVIVYAAFFAALIAMPIYGGAAYDKNGYQPFKAPVPIIRQEMGRQYHRLLGSAPNCLRRGIVAVIRS